MKSLTFCFLPAHWRAFQVFTSGVVSYRSWIGEEVAMFRHTSANFRINVGAQKFNFQVL